MATKVWFIVVLNPPLRLSCMSTKFIDGYQITAARLNLTKHLTAVCDLGSAEYLSHPDFSSTTKLLYHFASHPFITLMLSYHACDDTSSNTAMPHDRKHIGKNSVRDLVGT